ncbi:MAG: hypothetical protein ACU84H_02590 [Gammaproteobacteria bacterium]
MKALVQYLVLGAIIALSNAHAADHGDTPFLISENRHDARLTDLHAFTRGENLVIAIGTNPAIPNTLTSYKFASDLKITVGIDNHSVVETSNASDLEDYGGTIIAPSQISADHEITITFNESGGMTVKGKNTAIGASFAGLRDDPFIRTPRVGRNVAAIVIEVPLADVTANQSTILAWAEVRIEKEGRVELGGRALRSMFSENDCLNFQPPNKHQQVCGLVPDVVIYDTAAPAKFPNGRELADDVVTEVGDPRVVNEPATTENDAPFLNAFPYLAPPHS